MSNHTIFIVLSYSAGLLVLGWTALSPLIKKRSLRIQLEQMHRSTN